MNKFYTNAALSALAFISIFATSANADMINSSPIVLGGGFQVSTGVNVAGGALGQGSGGIWDFQQSANSASIQDINVGFSNCGICPNPNGEGQQEIAVTGMLGNMTQLNTLGNQTFGNHDGPAQLTIQHQLGTKLELDISTQEMPAPISMPQH